MHITHDINNNYSNALTKNIIEHIINWVHIFLVESIVFNDCDLNENLISSNKYAYKYMYLYYMKSIIE